MVIVLGFAKQIFIQKLLCIFKQSQYAEREFLRVFAHGHMTAANAMEHTNAKKKLMHGQDTGQLLQRTPLTRLPPGHNSVHS